MNKVQKQKPSRTCTKTYSKYTSFRWFLRNDFNQRCGYCDDPDTHYGQKVDYHIDHFKPTSKFPNLETNYSNLVYSCPYCNVAKSGKWQKTDGFVDPCDAEYGIHLERNNKGKIKAITPRGEYIVKSLKLFLKRHELIWFLVVLEEQKPKLDKAQTSDLNEVEALKKFRIVQNEIDNYINLLKSV
jgi:uncharacterized protein (TIGR02646 family)